MPRCNHTPISWALTACKCSLQNLCAEAACQQSVKRIQVATYVQLAAGAPKAPGTPAVALVDPTVRVTFVKADTTAVKYSAFVKDTGGDEVEVPLAVKPVTGSTTQLFALVAPDPPELPQGGTYTLQVGGC